VYLPGEPKPQSHGYLTAAVHPQSTKDYSSLHYEDIDEDDL